MSLPALISHVIAERGREPRARLDPDNTVCVISYGDSVVDDAATEDVFQGLDTEKARRFSKDLWRPIRRKLTTLDAAAGLTDLAVVPGCRLEALKGDQKGRYSIRVNDQYRITFRFEDGHAHAVRCEDYH